MGKAGPGPPGQGLPRPRPWKLSQSSNLIPYNAVQGEKELLLLSVPPGTSQVWTQAPLAWRPLFPTPAALTGSDPTLPVLSRGTQPSLARGSGLPRVSPQLPCCPWNSRQDSHRVSTHPSQQPDPCCSPPAPARATLAPFALRRGHAVSASWLCSAAPQPGEPPLHFQTGSKPYLSLKHQLKGSQDSSQAGPSPACHARDGKLWPDGLCPWEAGDQGWQRPSTKLQDRGGGRALRD